MPEKPSTHVVTARVSGAQFRAIEDFRWENRMTRTDVITLAVHEFLAAHGITVEPQN